MDLKTSEINANYTHYIKLIDSLRNIINRHYLDFNDLEIIFEYFVKSKNPDFKILNKLLQDFLETKDDKILNELEEVLTKLEESYYTVNRCIYIVNNQVVCQFPSQLLPVLFSQEINTDNISIESLSKYKGIAEKILCDSDCTVPISGKQFNLNYFILNIQDLVDLGFTIEKIELDDLSVGRDLIIQVYQFLLDSKQYKIGDSVATMSSKWREKNQKKVWRQGDVNYLKKTKSMTTHYVDLCSDTLVIHRIVEGPVLCSSSITKKFELINEKWQPIKVLQKLLG